MANILVVEDFPPIAKVVASSLRRSGHQITSEQTMTGALRLEGCFNFAVLDIDLPDGNGVTLAENLLSAERIESAIFFTGTRNAELLTQAAQLGVVVDKMHGLQPLLMAIEQLEDSVAARRAAVADSAIRIFRRSPLCAIVYRR